MQADVFYQTSKIDAIPLHLLSQSDYERYEPDALEQKIFATFQFKGVLGQHAIISDKAGDIQKIFIGTGDGREDKALAHAATSIPPGHYHLASELTELAYIHWALAQYRFNRYKTPDCTPRVLILTDKIYQSVLPQVRAIFKVRDLVNTPANDLTPAHIAEEMMQLAKAYQAEFAQWVDRELIEQNFPAIHAVGRGSANKPRLLSLTWGEPSHPKVTLIGKGVTFDSGGLDIKPASNMRLMKKDMGGAAQVIGLAQWIMHIKLPIRLQVFIPAVENSLGENAYRPGDVLTMRNGLRVEIDNTDAEGRLILADTIAKACEDKPELMLDFATLTGAARVAVGTEISALFTPHDELAKDLMQIGEEVGDPIWRLPLYADYAGMLDSTVADMVNSSPSSYAGATTAALFLQRFVESSVTWAHFDIMAWNVAAKPGKPEGGEAMAMRAVGALLKKRYRRVNE